MAFNTSQNNSKDNKTNLNTKGVQFYNKNGFDPSSLQFGYWNESVSIRITPALEPSKQSESKIYDYEKTVSTALDIEKLILLIGMIKKHIIPAIESGENKDIALQTGNSLFSVGTGKRLTGEIKPYVAIHKSINQDTKKPEMSIFYEFNQNQYIDNYNEGTGEYNVLNNIHAEFIAFYRCVIASVMALSQAFAHSERYVNKYSNDKLQNNVIAIANKVGADISSGYSGGYNRSTPINFDDDSNKSSQDNSSTKVENINSLEEFESMLGQM